MKRLLQYTVTLGFLVAVMPLCAAGVPHAEAQTETKKVWTNDDLENLRDRGLISIVGQVNEERPALPAAPKSYAITEDPEWYAAEAARLGDELEGRQTQLREYKKAIDDVRDLRPVTGGVTLDQGDLAITPEVGIEILERHVNEVQSEINELEDLAQRHDIPPGVLRGQ